MNFMKQDRGTGHHRFLSKETRGDPVRTHDTFVNSGWLVQQYDHAPREVLKCRQKARREAASLLPFSCVKPVRKRGRRWRTAMRRRVRYAARRLVRRWTRRDAIMTRRTTRSNRELAARHDRRKIRRGQRGATADDGGRRCDDG